MIKARRILSEAKLARQRLEQNADRLEELRHKAEGLAAYGDGVKVSSSPMGDAMANAVAELVDMTCKMMSDIIRDEKTINEAVELIHSLDDYRQMDVLYRAFIRCETVPEIADELFLSRSSVYALMENAIEELKNRGEEE